MDYVTIEKPRPHTSVIRMNRPERMNSMAFDLVVPLHDAIEKVAAETPEKILTEFIDPLLGLAPYQARQLAYGLKITEGSPDPKATLKQFLDHYQGAVGAAGQTPRPICRERTLKGYKMVPADSN